MRTTATASGALAAFLALGCGVPQERSAGFGESLSADEPGATGSLSSSHEFTNSVGMLFVPIPAGEFMMGSPEAEAGREFDEGPRHRARTTKPFMLGATEVTQAQWRAVMGGSEGSNPSHFKGDELPVEHVSWTLAREFIGRLSEKEGRTYRLPTEAEWEYACRAGTTAPYSLGETISTGQANYDGSYTYGDGARGVFRQETAPVGSFEPNAWGLHDMHGNVHEWCSDWYDAWYYEKSPTDDPPGGVKASDWTPRVLRGGSWESMPGLCRSAARHRDYPGYGDDFYGFRLVLEP